MRTWEATMKDLQSFLAFKDDIVVAAPLYEIPATAWPSNSNAEWVATGDSSCPDVEGEIYAFVSFCVHLLELETDSEKISRSRPKDRDLEMQAAIALRKEELLLKTLVLVTRKQVRRSDK
jgi:hypothetical protein